MSSQMTINKFVDMTISYQIDCKMVFPLMCRSSSVNATLDPVLECDLRCYRGISCHRLAKDVLA